MASLVSDARRPDIARVVGSLKDFQLASVEYAFRRLWLDDDAVKQFLVADEVGLGKTMVAKGVIAKAVDYLWDTEDRINIVYICSNSQIARQNLTRLNVVGAREHRHADRLTLLPKVIRQMRDERVNFVSFTPGTSMNLDASGKYNERVLLYWMLADGAPWGAEITSNDYWRNFFQVGMGHQNFIREIESFPRDTLDPELSAAFAAQVTEASDISGTPLREELRACAEAFDGVDRNPRGGLNVRREALISRLRKLVAGAAAQYLEPNLVILDEFQRFKGLLDPEAEDEAALLAQRVIYNPKAKTLLLSATPYKMYTLPDEPEGDDHYRDFLFTVEILAGKQEGKERANAIARDLRIVRDALAPGRDVERAKAAQERVGIQLRRIMIRTERLAPLRGQNEQNPEDRDGMLSDRQFENLKIEADDLRCWQTFDKVARALKQGDVFEYWRSTPYPLNLMDRDSYSIKRGFEAAAERSDPIVVEALSGGTGLLDYRDIRAYKRVDPGNAKMRALAHDVLDHGLWRLAWLPPSCSYYQLGGAFADAGVRSYTKRLVFSAWTVVPKAIAVLVSYNAECLAVEAERARAQEDGFGDRGAEERTYGAAVPERLRIAMRGGQPQGMYTVALLYPSLTLAHIGDPLRVARELGRAPSKSFLSLSG